MKEYIECRSCDSSYCNGCNIHTLATMLREGKLDALMDDKHSIKPYADAVERKRGEWENVAYWKSGNTRSTFYTAKRCSVCHADARIRSKHSFCPNCGADMREVDHEKS